MHGDLDDDAQIHAEIHARLTILARKPGVEAGPVPGTPGLLVTGAARSACMQRVFAAGQAAALEGMAGAAETERIDALAAQAVALAWIAGFLAGQLPPRADPLRNVVQTLTDGHAAPRRISDRFRAAMEDQHHHHGEGHGPHYHHHD